MANFEVKVYKLEIEEHPNADAIELAKVGDYRSIVRKGEFKTGDLGVYIPDGSIVPQKIISFLGLEGRLAGKQRNRVKAIKLRGVFSQGLIYPIECRKNVIDSNTNKSSNIFVLPLRAVESADILVKEGDEVAKYLGITKWEPPIPVCMTGEVYAIFGQTLKYDIENLKKFPDIFKDGEKVYLTEKIHGTWCCMGSHPEVDCPIITSKGLSRSGLAFKFNKANTGNLYINVFEATKDKNGTNDVVERVANVLGISLLETPLYLLGEIFGAGVQDLAYGGKKPAFRLFDIYVGNPTEGKYLDPVAIENIATIVNIDIVPTLYTGVYSKTIVNEYTGGKETISGSNIHPREGVVIKPKIERYDTELGRVILKSVSEEYYLRKGNTTEFN